MIVRQATVDDAAAMARLLNDIIALGGTTAHEVPKPVEAVRSAYVDEAVAAVVAEDNGVVIGWDGNRHAVLSALLAELAQACPGWISIQMGLVAKSSATQVVLDVAKREGYPVLCGAEKAGPYFTLRESPEVFRKHVTKGVLQMLRTSRNKFAKIGTLEFKPYCRAEDAAELQGRPVVVAAVQTPGVLVTRAMCEQVMHGRADRRMLVIDLSVPRAVDAD